MKWPYNSVTGLISSFKPIYNWYTGARHFVGGEDIRFGGRMEQARTEALEETRRAEEQARLEAG